MPATFAPRASAVSATTLPSAPSAPVTTMTLLFMAELRVKTLGSSYRRSEITCNGPAIQRNAHYNVRWYVRPWGSHDRRAAALQSTPRSGRLQISVSTPDRQPQAATKNQDRGDRLLIDRG